MKIIVSIRDRCLKTVQKAFHLKFVVTKRYNVRKKNNSVLNEKYIYPIRDKNSFSINSNSFFVLIRHNYEFLFASSIVFRVVWAYYVENVGVPMTPNLWNTLSKYCRTYVLVIWGEPGLPKRPTQEESSESRRNHLFFYKFLKRNFRTFFITFILNFSTQRIETGAIQICKSNNKEKTTNINN